MTPMDQRALMPVRQVEVRATGPDRQATWIQRSYFERFLGNSHQDVGLETLTACLSSHGRLVQVVCSLM